MSLRWKISLGMALIAAVVAFAGAIGAFVTTDVQVRAAIDETLRSRADELTKRGPDSDRRSDRRRPVVPRTSTACGFIGPTTDADVVQVIAVDGTVTACSGSTALEIDRRDLEVAAGKRGSYIDDKRTDEGDFRVLTISRPGGGGVQVGRNLDETDRVFEGLGKRLMVIALIGILAAAALGWLLARRITRPIDRLRSAAQHIAETGDLATPIVSSGHDEVGSLATSFNSMVEALDTSRQQQQRLISDASHEMRTPLTSLRTNVELLQRAADLPLADRAEVLSDIRYESEELTTLLSELVELATDHSLVDEPLNAVDLVELTRPVAERATRRSGRSIVISDRGSVAVRGVSSQLERVISNLVDNAIKYSPDGSEIEIVIEAGSLEVIDHGSGFADDDLPHVFQRFYRATDARAQPGSGLGLAIVEQIVQRHGGSVTAANSTAGGAVVGFALPVWADVREQ